MNAEDHTAEIMDALREAQRLGMAFSPELLTALLQKEITKIKAQEHKALALWKEWLGDVPNFEPFYCNESGTPLACFFCGQLWENPIMHKPDCIYLRARRLVEGG